MLHIDDLHTRPSEGDVGLRGVSLEVAAASAVALVGSNGGGRTALCRCLAGRLPRTRGTILLRGAPWPEQSWKAARAGALIVLAHERVFEHLSVRDNLTCSHAWWSRPARHAPLADVLDLFPALRPRLSQTAGTLSGGEQQMVVLGRALLTGAMLIVLEEPWLGLAPKVIDSLLETMRRVRRATGTAFVWTEEDRARALAHADTAYEFVDGQSTPIRDSNDRLCLSS